MIADPLAPLLVIDDLPRVRAELRQSVTGPLYGLITPRVLCAPSAYLQIDPACRFVYSTGFSQAAAQLRGDAAAVSRIVCEAQGTVAEAIKPR